MLNDDKGVKDMSIDNQITEIPIKDRIIIHSSTKGDKLLTKAYLMNAKKTCKSFHGNETEVLLKFGALQVYVYACPDCQNISSSHLNEEDVFNVLVYLGCIDPSVYPFEVTKTWGD